MKTLILSFNFTASHSLAVRETPHEHVWLLTLGVKGMVQNGFIVNLVTFREDVETLIAPLKNTFLNDSDYVSHEAKKSPTCETLCDFFWDRVKEIVETHRKENHSISLTFVEVALCEEGVEVGRVRRDTE